MDPKDVEKQTSELRKEVKAKEEELKLLKDTGRYQRKVAREEKAKQRKAEREAKKKAEAEAKEKEKKEL